MRKLITDFLGNFKLTSLTVPLVQERLLGTFRINCQVDFMQFYLYLRPKQYLRIEMWTRVLLYINLGW